MTQETINALHSDGHDNHGHDDEPIEPYVPSTGFLGQVEEMCESVFHVRKRKTTIRKELVCGLIQFISCLYVLPVVPEQMSKAGYDDTSSIVSTAACCCLGNLYGSFLTNMPFIVAPPTSVSIFLSVFLRQQNLGRKDGNAAVILSGLLLMLVGIIRPLGGIVSRV